MKKTIIISILLSLAMFAQPKYSSLAGMPGAFSRMGFGARGIGMGNAMSAVTEGNLVSYYNPAVTVFQEGNSFQTSYSFLSLDRSLNFINFTRRFDFYSSTDKRPGRKPRSSAGLSAGIINAGVSGIIGTDNQGLKTGDLSTSENQFFLGFSNRFSENISIGITVKLYYYKLYEEINSTGVGLDIGAVYSLNQSWKMAAVITDINSKYRWDTAPIYGQEGTTTEDRFPLLKKIGVSYSNKDDGILAAVEFESSGSEANILRGGIEYNIFEKLFLRAGVDQFNFSNSDWAMKPSAGFSYTQMIGNFAVGVDYAFMMEQYSPHDRHIVGVSVVF